MSNCPLEYLSDPVRHHARVRPTKPAIVFRDRITTYSDLDKHANRVANALIERGLTPQARIGILAGNTDRFFEIWHGASRANVVLTPLNFRLAPEELRYIIDDAEVQMLFVGEEHVSVVEQMTSDLPRLRTIIALEGSDEALPDYVSWRDRHGDADPAREHSVDDTVVQYYSSGTTGFPKGVELSHRNLMRHTPIWLEENGRWDESDIALVPMPLFHVAGSAFGNAALIVGGTNVVMPHVDPRGILEAIGAHGITRICVVPAVIRAMLQDPECVRTDFSRVRRILYGASPMPKALAERALDVIGPCLEQTYGATETAGGFTRLSPTDHQIAAKLESCGRPMHYARARVVDDRGQDCAPNVVGEIVVRGDCVMKGYWRAPEATREAMRDGWYHTRDAGYFDEDGYLYVYDRIDDMIISGGENVYPAEVERVLRAHPDISDVAVFGVPDEVWGEAVKAVIVTAPGRLLDEAAIIRFCRERLAHYKCPKSVDVTDIIPRNPAGKVLKKELRKPFWAHRKRRVR